MAPPHTTRVIHEHGYPRRAHNTGHHRQLANLAGYALVVNGVTSPRPARSSPGGADTASATPLYELGASRIDWPIHTSARGVVQHGRETSLDASKSDSVPGEQLAVSHGYRPTQHDYHRSDRAHRTRPISRG